MLPVRFDLSHLKEYLLSLATPVMEIAVINNFHQSGYINKHAASTYELHFSLFHSLYTLKFSADFLGYHINIDSMNIFCLKIPESGCTHYYKKTGSFCGKDASGRFCAEHESLYRYSSNLPEPDFLSPFYRDAENFYLYSEDDIRRMIAGVKQFIFNRKEVEAALSLFGLVDADADKIKIRYYTLVKKYHPDISGKGGEMITRINAAYDLLMRTYGSIISKK